MNPVAILRHSPSEGPGYFGIFLSRRGIPWELIRVDAAEPLPADSRCFSGLCLMGGPMSVNDDLPWIPRELVLIREALAAGQPVLGHCLGAQLMARALGAPVEVNPVKEIGWHALKLTGAPEAREWLGDEVSVPVFQWHGETFALPAGTVRLAGSPYCANQAFAVGNSLALQCHIEMTAELVEAWCDSGQREIAANPGPSVQEAAEMRRDLAARLGRLHAVAERVYTRWCAGLGGA